METLEKGFLINVFSDKSCPGLLVSILEAFEDLGLNVLEARVSCTDSFRLEAFGGEVRFLNPIFIIFIFTCTHTLSMYTVALQNSLSLVHTHSHILVVR